MLTRSRIDRKAARANHVNQWHRSRKLIEDAVAKLIAEQMRSAGKELVRTGIPRRTAIFNVADWRKRLIQAIAPALGRVMMYGAAAELLRHRKLLGKEKSSSATDYATELGLDFSDFETELPEELKQAISDAIARNLQEAYWSSISGTTANKIETVLRRGLIDGLSTIDIARQLEQQADIYGRTRATAVARTESAAVLTEGRALSIDSLSQETGVEFGLEWLSVQGATTRPEHAALDGTTVRTGETFNLGGEQARWPADPSLSAGQRVNCLCTILSSVLDE